MCGCTRNRCNTLYFDVTDAAAVKSAFMSIFKREGRD